MSQFNLEIGNVCFYNEKNSFCKLKATRASWKIQWTLILVWRCISQTAMIIPPVQSIFKTKSQPDSSNCVLQHVNIKSSFRTQGWKWHRKSGSNWATVLKDPEWTTRGQSTRTSGSSWDISFSHLSQMATTFNALKFKPTKKTPEQFLPPPRSSSVKYCCYL